MRTCSRFPECSRTAIKGGRLCARCKGEAWRASHQPVRSRDQLVEDSGLPFSEAGLSELDKLSWPQLQGVVGDLAAQEAEFLRLVERGA